MTLSSFLIPVAVLAIIAIGTAGTRKRPSSKEQAPKSIEDKTPFKVEHVATEPLTATEAMFFRRLVDALPEAVVVPQMAMAALVDIADYLKRGKYKRYEHTNRAGFAQKRLDYVVLDRATLQVVCVIELDDHTHDGAERKAGDAERDAILEGVGYTVLRFDARKMPTVAELREHFGE
jgi:hypothetical protein